MKNTIFFIVQAIIIFLLLSSLTYFLPWDLGGQIIAGFFALLFVSVFFDYYLKRVNKIDLEVDSGYSDLRNTIIAKGYLGITILLFLAATGSVLSRNPAPQTALIGIPLLLIWFVLLKYGLKRI